MSKSHEVLKTLSSAATQFLTARGGTSEKSTAFQGLPEECGVVLILFVFVVVVVFSWKIKSLTVDPISSIF